MDSKELLGRYYEDVWVRDRAAVYWTMEWTQRGDFFGAPADGKRMTMRGADFYRLRDGRIAETWHVEDMLGVFIQLGMMPNQ